MTGFKDPRDARALATPPDLDLPGTPERPIRRVDAGRIGRPALAGLLLLIPAFFGVKAAVRAYVDHQIEQRRGEPLPDFALEDREGHVVSRQTLLGRPAMIHFFRSRCVNCEQESPELKAFVAELDPAAVSVISVMTDPVEGYPAEVTDATIARHAYAWPVLMADKAFIDKFHGAGWSHVTPITYFVDKDGVIVTTLRGAQTRETLRPALRRAIDGA